MNRLLSLREEKGLSQEQVAELLKVSRQAYSRYERGERELGYSSLSKLSKFFDVSIDYLLGFSDLYYPDTVKRADEATADESCSAEEKELIEDYRALSAANKKLVRQMMDSLSPAAAPKK